MKPLLAFILMLMLCTTVQAQSTIARIKYEQAEEAFEKNDFAGTLQRLDEAQKILGSVNPKILFLRIMAQKGMVATGNYEFSLLEDARKNTDYFMKNYEKNEGIEEKFKEVYLFSEVLEKLPKTESGYAYLKAAPKREKEAKEARALAFFDSLATAYKFKKGLTEEAFRAYNSYSAELVDRKKLAKNYIVYNRKHSLFDTDDGYLYNEGPLALDMIDGIASFKYNIKKGEAQKNTLDDATRVFNELKALVHQQLLPEQVSESDTGNFHMIQLFNHQSQLATMITIILSVPGNFKEKYRINVVEISFN